MPLVICLVCNKRFRYNRYIFHLLNDELPHVRFHDTHLLCRKKLREFEENKLKLAELFESHGINIVDFY